jgi:hypothetical protein
MAPSTEATITPTLEFEPRINLPKWMRALQTFSVKHYKEIYRREGLLTASLTDAQWDLHQLNRTPNANAALPDDITPRPNVAMPADHLANATNAVVRIYERAVAIHDAHLNGLTTLLDALIASIGPANALLFG